MFKKSLLTLFILFLYHTSKSQVVQGCANALSNQVHYQRNGFGVGTGNTSKPRFDVTPYSTFTSNTSICPRYTSISQKNPIESCCIGTDCGILNTVYIINNIPCPIDSNTVLLLVAMGGIGIVSIRRLALS